MSDSIDNLLRVPMFNVKCLRCFEEFNIHFKYISKKDIIICPCCGQGMDSSAYEKLKNSVALLNEFLEMQHKNNSWNESFSVVSHSKEGFSVSVDWKNKLPSKDDASFL